MTFAIRGVIEGFYGRPWSWPERDRMIDFMGETGYNLYMYAPKNDPIHRNRWREPYLPEELELFKDLLVRCRAKNIEFVFGMSPLEFHYTSQDDLDTLWGKLVPLYDLGVRGFSVLLDDMPEKFRYPDDEAKFGTLGSAQAWLNNHLLERLSALGEPVYFNFCPTEYHGEGRSAYLETLGKELHPSIDVFWTGREVCAQYLTTEDARIISETLRRPVLYWDNYPVNDGEMHFHPHIRPVRGRDKDLDTACRGIVANGALEAEANKIPLHTYAAYMADPVNYDPEAAWQVALEAICGNKADAEAVGMLGELSRRSALERGHHLDNFLLPRFARFWERWGGLPAGVGPELPELPAGAPVPPATAPNPDRQAAVDEIAETFAAMSAAAGRILGEMANPYLKPELRPWAEKMLGWAGVGEAAVAVLRQALANPHDPALKDLRRAVLERIFTTRENFFWVNGDLVDQFARRCLWAAAALAQRS